ncbi:hypothetical protein K458DRAFT_403835 [Lentithecium fluviatile CBS 122367]|uniref:Uncharacterized protein n=1 Tax=Lentithecium fluviatile CBS 122367 TaxID=1168545 RepID=A0A6G1J3V5_9PLEO|nr:hypothetical protein K458DRAFT_403835 [Lentithecium fluviatile CBS 122367]
MSESAEMASMQARLLFAKLCLPEPTSRLAPNQVDPSSPVPDLPAVSGAEGFDADACWDAYGAREQDEDGGEDDEYSDAEEVVNSPVTDLPKVNSTENLDVDAVWNAFDAAEQDEDDGEEWVDALEVLTEQRQAVTMATGASTLGGAAGFKDMKANALSGGLILTNIDAILEDFTDDEDETELDSAHTDRHPAPAKVSYVSSNSSPAVDTPVKASFKRARSPTTPKGSHPAKKAKKTKVPATSVKAAVSPNVDTSEKRGHKKKMSTKAKRAERAKAKTAFLQDQERENQELEEAAKNISNKADQPESSSAAGADTTAQCHSPETATSLPKDATSLKYQPVSHELILEGEFGYGRFKSRLVFEADPCPPEDRYATSVHFSGYHITSSHRMSATRKFHDWRNKGKMSKLKDGELRRNERLVYLVEHAPFGPKGEAGYWADEFKTMEKWVKNLMPDSYVVIKTHIPPSGFVGAGQFRQYVDALRYLLKTCPHHFSVELEDESILNCDVSQFFPTNSGEFNPEVQVQYLSKNRLCTLRSLARGPEQIQEEAEAEEQQRRLARQAQFSRRNEPIDKQFIDRFIENRFEELKQEVLDSLQARLQTRCDHIAAEFTYIRNFIRDVKYFRNFGVLPQEQPKPFQSIKPKKKKPKSKPFELAYKGFDARQEDEIDPAAEARKIVTVLPWIKEERALQHMQQMVQLRREDPGAEYPPLEVLPNNSPETAVLVEDSTPTLMNSVSSTVESHIPLLGATSGAHNTLKPGRELEDTGEVEGAAEKAKLNLSRGAGKRAE